MALYNLGSINADLVYSVPHIPAPGETLSSTSRAVYLGGKGANMSVAASRAGARVVHIGALGADGAWARERLAGYGIATDFISEVAEDTAQAVIAVAEDGENAIILAPGANHAIPADLIERAFGDAAEGDWFVCQNETILQAEAMAAARARGLRTAYAAAPFDAAAVEAVLDGLDFLILNAVEAGQLREARGTGPADLPVANVVVTRGGEGAEWFENRTGTHRAFAAVPIRPVDTTGAGDTFTGYLLAGLDSGLPMADAIERAGKAGALMCTRRGTADVIPTLAEVEAFAP